jgi:hypothetical protein
MRASILTLAAVGIFAASICTAQTGIDVSSFVKETTKAGTLIQDPDAPVSFQLRPGWTLKDGSRWRDHETTLLFEEIASGITVSLYYQSPLQTPYLEGPDAALRQGMEDKVLQRQRAGLPDYHIRAESVELRQVGDQPALSFIAEFTSAGQTRYEYMLRVLGKTVKAHFFVMGIPANEDINAFCKRFEPIAAGLRIP